jgi:filamentous hemagglutinin family protein
MKYSVPKLLRLSGKIVMAGLVLPFSAPTKAEVTLDGSLGPTGPIPLVNQNFEIPDTVGQTVGTNLFHSFGVFNINTGESATFTGPSSIENVLGRVTGGSFSFIDGLLRTQFENASPNLFLLNPAGVLFGPNASLDVQGSFHVSTADYMKLGDGGRFEATHPENSVLTTAPPEAFGFLGEKQPAGITVQGSLLKVRAGETLSVVGGDIQIADGSLYAPGGRIDIVSVASPGEVLPHAPDLGVDSFERLGRIEVSHSSSERPRRIEGDVIGNVDASGEGRGRIFIRGGELVADNGSTSANTWGSEEGQGIIDIGVTGQVTMRNEAEIRGGNVIVTADRVSLYGTPTAIIEFPSTNILAFPGNVAIQAGSLEVRNGATIEASRLSQEPEQGSGNMTVTADRVFLSGDEAAFAGVYANNMTVTAGSLEVRNGASIGSPSTGRKESSVTVAADRVFLSGDGANFEGFPIPTGILANEFDGVGSAGDITVTAGNLEVRNGAEISASIEGPGQGVMRSARGGNVKINATDITLQDGGRISAESENIKADAGNITLEVGNLLHLSNDSSITTSVTGGTGKGGNITLNSVFVVLDEGSSIIANAERGQGGNILIHILRGGALFRSPDSLIEASSEFGIDGSVVIDAPDTDIIAGFVGLPANFLDAATVLTQLCAERSGANVSSLVVRKYEVLPD